MKLPWYTWYVVGIAGAGAAGVGVWWYGKKRARITVSLQNFPVDLPTAHPGLSAQIWFDGVLNEEMSHMLGGSIMLDNGVHHSVKFVFSDSAGVFWTADAQFYVPADTCLAQLTIDWNSPNTGVLLSQGGTRNYVCSACSFAECTGWW